MKTKEIILQPLFFQKVLILNFDSEGRVSIPKKLLNHAKIKSNIVFVGLGKVFQMWDPKLFEKFKSIAKKNLILIDLL